MNKVPLRKYIDKLKHERRMQLKKKCNQKNRDLRTSEAKAYYESTKDFFIKLSELDPPEDIYEENGYKLNHMLANTIKVAKAFKKARNSESKMLYEVVEEYFEDDWRNTTQADRDYEKAIEKLNEEFSKLQGNLKTMSGKEGTAYCIEQGIPIPNPEKAKNEVLAPIDIKIIKGK